LAILGLDSVVKVV
jgi:hypothetical protein